MRFAELLRFALRSLRRQRVRTLLTMLGVAVAACMLAFSVSLSFGLQDLIRHEFHSRPGFWEIAVYPGLEPPPIPEDQIPPEKIQVQGEFSAERAARLRRQLINRYRDRHAQKPPAALTADTLEQLAQLPNVNEVVTARFGQGWGYWGDQSVFVNLVSGRSEHGMLIERLLAGRMPAKGAAECVISEMLLYDLGGKTDAQMEAALGTPITVEFGEHRRDRATRMARDLTGAADPTRGEMETVLKMAKELPALIDKLSLSEVEKQTLKAMLTRAVPLENQEKTPVMAFTIVGIARAPLAADETERGNYYFRWSNLYTDGPASEPLFRQLHHLKDGHYDQAEVKVQPGSDLPATVDAIEALGFKTSSSAEWFLNAKREVTLIGAGLNVFAIVALLVAALGITNTLVTSVVERTREIGMMKAVGATSGQVRILFLIEGTLIGIVGGILGLGLARLLAGPADEFVKQQVQALMGKYTLMTESIFYFPMWLNLATPLFAAAITTLAALYPSHRASRIAPIEALRYG